MSNIYHSPLEHNRNYGNIGNENHNTTEANDKAIIEIVLASVHDFINVLNIKTIYVLVEEPLQIGMNAM